MPFATERELSKAARASEHFRLAMVSDEGALHFERIEFAGIWGIPDLMMASFSSGDRSSSGWCPFITTAFEMKLAHWQRALAQAYRYRAFADQVFVVLDHDRVGPALRRIERFERSNVGLMSVSQAGEVVVHFRPAREAPFSDHMAARARERLFGPGRWTGTRVTPNSRVN